MKKKDMMERDFKLIDYIVRSLNKGVAVEDETKKRLKEMEAKLDYATTINSDFKVRVYSNRIIALQERERMAHEHLVYLYALLREVLDLGY